MISSFFAKLFFRVRAVQSFFQDWDRLRTVQKIFVPRFFSVSLSYVLLWFYVLCVCCCRFFCVVSGHFFSFLPCKCSFFCSGISPIHFHVPPDRPHTSLQKHRRTASPHFHTNNRHTEGKFIKLFPLPSCRCVRERLLREKFSVFPTTAHEGNFSPRFFFRLCSCSIWRLRGGEKEANFYLFLIFIICISSQRVHVRENFRMRCWCGTNTSSLLPPTPRWCLNRKTDFWPRWEISHSVLWSEHIYFFFVRAKGFGAWDTLYLLPPPLCHSPQTSKMRAQWNERKWRVRKLFGWSIHVVLFSSHQNIFFVHEKHTIISNFPSFRLRAIYAFSLQVYFLLRWENWVRSHVSQPLLQELPSPTSSRLTLIACMDTTRR